jgi:HlyD family secretion protein
VIIFEAKSAIIVPTVKENKKPFIKRLFSKRNIIIGIIVLVVGGLIYGFSVGQSKDVEKYNVSKGTVKEELIISGTVKADKYSAMAFAASGKLAWIGVTEGQEVYQGQALAKLDAKLLNSAYESAKSNLRSADANAQYVLDTVKDHSSDETYLQKTTRTTAEVAKDNAWEALKIAEENLRNSTLYAPFKGVIASLTNSAPGVNVTFADQILEIIDPKTIYFQVFADQTEIIKLKIGDSVEVQLDSYPDNKLQGKITYLSLTPQRGEVGSVYKVRVEFKELANIDPRVGMTGDARFTMKQKEDVLYAPSNFVKTNKKGTYVMVNNAKNKVYVETGIEGEEYTEIIGNIKEGDTLLD